jgi:exopolyphosphatase/guanosine-5'-triphosphate,3'-diphosphate pyrophosphatase
VRLATIDVGTNTTLLLVAEVAADGAVEVLAERAEITRLGRGIGKDGRLGAAGIAATLDVLRDYAALALGHGARIAAVGTEALRRAPNASELLQPAAAILGTEIEVIDGDREAALTFRAAAAAFPVEAAGTLVVVDIGGGSTEIVVAEAGRVAFRRSLPLGSVRLTERHIEHDPPLGAEVAAVRAEVRAALDAVPLPAGDETVVGVAGTVTSLAAMVQRLASYDPDRVHGYDLALPALHAEIVRLERATQAERERIVGLDPRRADVILAGAIVLEEIAMRAGTGKVKVSDRGIRWGLLQEMSLSWGDRPAP